MDGSVCSVGKRGRRQGDEFNLDFVGYEMFVTYLKMNRGLD